MVKFHSEIKELVLREEKLFKNDPSYVRLNNTQLAEELITTLELSTVPDLMRKKFASIRKFMGITTEAQVRHSGNDQPPDSSSSKSSIQFEAKTNSLVIDSPISKDVDELLKRFKIDKEYWDITRQVINEWGSEANYNRQCKAWLQAKGDIIDWNTFKRQLIEDIKKDSPSPPAIKFPKPKKVDDQNMLEINIFDLHLGKLAWAEETGARNYDANTAVSDFQNAIADLVRKSSGFRIDQILFPVGNDFFHTDGDYPFPHTTKGTPQQEDLRWQKIFRMGRQLLSDSILYLSEIAPVHVYVVPGNHDHQKSFYLGDVLEAKFENNPNVKINNQANPIKYHKYGSSLIGFAHGRPSDISVDRLLQIMPMEKPQWWADTLFREWHLGDIHHKRTIKLKSHQDHQGIVVRYMRSLAAVDSWEGGKGYRGSVRGAEAYIWNFEYGKVAELNHNLINK